MGSTIGSFPKYLETWELHTVSKAPTSLWSRGKPGAFAYLISREGMAIMLNQSLAKDVKPRCSQLTADDCFLGFSAIDIFHNAGPLLAGLYYATPPLFTVQRGGSSTHFEREIESADIALASGGYCVSLHANCLALAFGGVDGAPRGVPCTPASAAAWQNPPELSAHFS